MGRAIYFHSGDIIQIVVVLMFPLARILALFSVAPVFGQPGIPKRIRLVMGLAIAFAVTPGVAIPPQLHNHPQLLFLLGQQVLLGFAMGFCMRLVFSALDLAGDLIGTQMSLSFASSYDPQSGSDNPLLANFLSWLSVLVFLSMDGHLMMLTGVIESYRAFPVDAMADRVTMANIAYAGAKIFWVGLLLALPVVATLLVTNLALGVLSRAAPSLNLFSIGFPVTLVVGFGALLAGLRYFAPVLERLYQDGFELMALF